MGPANSPRHSRSPGRRAGEVRVLADQVLRIGDELLDAGTDDARLTLQVLAHRAYLALEPATVLLDGALDEAATLAQLALDPGAGPADLTLEPVAGACAAARVALELAPEPCA